MSRNTFTLKTETETFDMEVQTAAHDFAKAIAESVEFQAFERAAEQLGQDEVAQEALQEFQSKQQSLQMLLRLNAVSPADRAELERLQKAFLDRASVVGYMEAQEKLMVLGQAAANLLSERIGLSYTAACGPGCC